MANRDNNHTSALIRPDSGGKLLSNSEQELRSILENIPDTIARYNLDFRRVYVNPAFGAMVEGGAPVLLGKTPSEFPGGTNSDVYETKIKEVIATGKSAQFELKWCDKDGKEICSLIQLTPEYDLSGAITSVLGIGRDITELNNSRNEIIRVKENLQMLEERFRVSQIYGGIGIWENDLTNNRQYWSEGVTDLLGFPKLTAPTYENFLNTVYLEDRDHVNNAYKSHLENGKPYDIDYRIVDSDGRLRWMRSIGKAECDSNGKQLRIRGIVQDISEIKKHEWQLAQRGFALNHISEAAYMMNEKGCFQYVNEEACRILGYTRDELLGGMGVPDIGQGWTNEMWAEHWQDVKANGSCLIEAAHKTKDGRVFPIEVSANYFEYKGQSYIMSVVRDISGRKQVEQVLCREIEKNRMLFKTAADGLHILDSHGNLLQASDSFCRMLEYTQEEMRGMNVLQWDIQFAPDICFEEIVNRIPENGLVLETRQRCKNGRVIDVEIYTNVISIEGEQFVYASSRDITERKSSSEALTKSMRQLEEKELAKTRFLAAAGHDLRQPLAAANLFIDALKFTETTPEQNQIIQRLDQAMSNFNELLDTLLNVSKLDAGIIKPEFTLVHVAEIINWLEESFAPLAAKNNLRFRLYFPMKKDIVVFCDIGLLKSVLMNLVSNALKFTSTGGILVSARQRGNNVLFQVWDTGIGINDENIEKIFDDFYQVDNPQRDRTKGLGLGLSIAKRALALFDSKITCRSHLGRGSVFEFHLPMDNISSNTIQEKPVVESMGSEVNGSFVRGKHFIVLEDDLMVSEALRKSLEMMGGEVECFDNAEKALKQVNIENADCYIIDYMLNGSVDGINFLNLLHQKLHRPICAVMMSGDTSAAFIRKAELFDWPVLHKPISLSKIISRLSEQHSRHDRSRLV